MWSKQFLLFLSTGLVAAACDNEACNTSISPSVGLWAAGVCSVVGVLLCEATFGVGCLVSAGCGIAGALAGPGPNKSSCGFCGQEKETSGEQLRGLIGQVLSQILSFVQLWPVSFDHEVFQTQTFLIKCVLALSISYFLCFYWWLICFDLPDPYDSNWDSQIEYFNKWSFASGK